MKLYDLGIKIYSAKITDTHYQCLLNEYESNLDNHTLANINPNYWGGECRSFKTKQDHEILEHAKRYLDSIGVEKNLKHHNQWINVQANDGFLGIHDHFGNISYVIYLKVPDYIKNYEGQKPTAMPYAEGLLTFLYGHQTSLFSDITHILPEEGMIYMFPAELRHYVYPFKDRDSKRVSVSGNLLFVS